MHPKNDNLSSDMFNLNGLGGLIPSCSLCGDDRPRQSPGGGSPVLHLFGVDGLIATRTDR